MGQALSCLDPAREHPPYSWPKDHPDRAKAIAEIKKRRREEKVRGIGGNARSVGKKSKSMEKSMDDADKTAAPPVALDAEPADAAAPGVSPETAVDADTRAAAAAAVAAGDEETAQLGERVAPDEPELVHVDDDETDDAAAPVGEEDGKDSEDREIVSEVMKDADVGLTEEEKLAKAEREAAAKERVERARAEAEKKRKLQPKGRLDEDLEKEEFVDAKDELPEAKEIDAKVVDPVTGDVVSQDEFRKRVQTRGIITDRVSKFEQNEEKAALEKAEFEAQKEARNVFKRSKSSSPSVDAPIVEPETTTAAPVEDPVEAVRQETVEEATEETTEDEAVEDEAVKAIEDEAVEAVEYESVEPVDDKAMESFDKAVGTVDDETVEATAMEATEREAVSSPVSAS